MASAFSSDTKFGLSPTLIDFIAGTVSGIAGIFVGQPLDTVKTRLQTPGIGQNYRSTFHALVTIVKQEKIKGLYKGVTSPLATCALLNGLVFASQGWFLNIQLKNPLETPTLSQVVLAGVATGVVASIITAPVELVKIRQQNELLTNPSVRSVTTQLYRQHGIRGLYRGLTATILRDTGFGAYFGSYEASCRLFTPNGVPSAPNPTPPWWGLLFAGGIAGVIGWAATFPMDVVKTRVQNTGWTPRVPVDALLTQPAQPFSSQNAQGKISVPVSSLKENPYRTTLSTIVNSYREEGASVFFRGLSTTVIRAIPVNIVVFAVFGFTVQMLT